MKYKHTIILFLELAIIFFYFFYQFENQFIKTILGTLIIARIIHLAVQRLSKEYE